jgi:hypothetical protein
VNTAEFKNCVHKEGIIFSALIGCEPLSFIFRRIDFGVFQRSSKNPLSYRLTVLYLNFYHIRQSLKIMDCQMKLLVGDSDSRILIDTVPEVMANASPVFRTMLQPDRFLEGQKLLENKTFTVTLAEDDPSAMKILCDIVHLRNDQVPSKGMTTESLVVFATLVDKYDCAIAIHPWPMLWLADLKSSNHLLNDVKYMNEEELCTWIYISCHLGYGDLLRKCTSVLIQQTTDDTFQADSFLSSCVELTEMIRGMTLHAIHLPISDGNLHS